MIVYVETNFVMEMAREQEESAGAGALLRLGERGRLSLRFPAIAITEPFFALENLRRHREEFIRSLNDQLRELRRSSSHSPLAEGLERLGASLLEVQRREATIAEATVGRLLRIGHSIELTASILEECERLRRFDLSTQDGIVLAAVLADAAAHDRAEPKCFVSQNTKDFNNPEVKEMLDGLGCRYIARYSHAVGYIESAIGPEP